MPNTETVLAETVTEISHIESILGAFFLVVLLAGPVIFIHWLRTTSFGKTALVDSKPRRNNMPFYLPLLLIALWIVCTALGIGIVSLIPNMADWQDTLAMYIVRAAAGLIVIAFIIAVGKKMFARRLAGFGLSPKNIPNDFASAIINLIAVLPLVIAIMYLVGYFGELFYGKEFQMQTNEGLTDLVAHPQLWAKLAVSIFAVLIVPVFEEFLFRGLLQTTLRNHNITPWPAIFLTSAIFAILHPGTHFPAIFALSVCFGYAYEKSGSLFRPIFAHMVFNAINITATWFAQPL